MNDLGFWMAMFTLGALAYYETPLGRVLRAVARSLWELVISSRATSVTGQPRDQLGRWASPEAKVTAMGNEAQRPLPIVTAPVTALQSEVTEEKPVTEVVTIVTIDEAVYITAQLVQGVAPSEVTKQLPGYTPKRYHDFATKVKEVKAILATQEQKATKEAPSVA